MSDERTIGERLVKALKRPAIGGPAALVVLLVIAFYGWSFTCPCERTPGAVLYGYEQPFPVDDWTFANDVTLCQIQINAGFRPHAINLNCFANDEGNLYLSCSSCDGKLWSGFAIRDGRAWLRRARPQRLPGPARGPRARSASGRARSPPTVACGSAGRPTNPAGVRAVPRRRLPGPPTVACALLGAQPNPAGVRAVRRRRLLVDRIA